MTARTKGLRRGALEKRARILSEAVDRTTTEGLASLSIGGLASAIGMSKSGLFAHFGSKEELQLAVIERAERDFEQGVLAPAEAADPGLARLRALVFAWLAYVESIAYPGGCFFDAASTEYGSQVGPVRDRLAAVCGLWRDALAEQAHVAVHAGELAKGTDPDTLAFQLHAYAGEANWARQLLSDDRAFGRARAAVAATLAAAGAAE